MGNGDENVQVLLLVFAAMTSVLVMFVFSARKELTPDQVLQKAFLEHVPYEWVFLEEVIDALYAAKDENIQKALEALIPTDSGSLFKECYFSRLAGGFVQAGYLWEDVVIYSEKNREKHIIFRHLPQWKKKECDDALLWLENSGEGEIEASEIDLRGYPPPQNIVELTLLKKKPPSGGPPRKKEMKTKPLFGELYPTPLTQ